MRSHRRRQRSAENQACPRRSRRLLVALEELESRVLLSGAAHPLFVTPDIASVPPPSGGPANLPPYTPAAMRAAYGFNNVMLLNPATGQQITGDGSGQTIAVVDAYDNPNLAADLANFDQIFGLPAANLVKIDQNGNPVNGQVAASASWGLEEALDVEWAHALAPKANILLVEGLSNYNNDLYAAVQKAASYTGGIITTRANVVSNSWGEGEYAGETADDAVFTTSDNHATFVFSAGDNGAPAIYPSASPNVLSVGGTKLTMNMGTNGPVYGSEVGWSLGGDNVPPYNNPYIGSGGGPSAYESEPSYQLNVQLALGARGTPDVALQADPLTGVYVLDTFGGGSSSGWYRVGGTSFSAPAWAALLTIVNQGQAFTGAAPVGAGAQASLYNLQHATGYYSSSNPNAAFRDITSGYNGYNAGAGYDFVTGVGTPLVNNLTSWIVYHIAPGGGGGGTGTRIGGGRNTNNNTLGSPVPGSESLITAVSSSSKQAFVAATGGSVTNRLIAGVASPISTVGLPASVSLTAAAESYRAFTAAPVAADNDLGPTRSNAPVSSDSDLQTITVPEAGKPAPAAMFLSLDESAPSSWTRQSDGVASAIPLADESPADLAMAAAMALAVTGSWSALDPIEAERKQASV